MFGDDLSHGIGLRLLLHFAVDPRAFRPLQDGLNARLVLGQWPIVQVGGVAQVASVASGVDFDVEHLLGDNPAVARPRPARVLNGVFEVEKHARCLP